MNEFIETLFGDLGLGRVNGWVRLDKVRLAINALLLKMRGKHAPQG